MFFIWIVPINHQTHIQRVIKYKIFMNSLGRKAVAKAKAGFRIV